ncbi:hypothetical protein [Pseudomonas aeruginosa]|uniref:hypothetical protein n=2 Tax=Pseudomonadales TaxID=72274 RepID=UPI000FFE4946|nr:hypothetical protein [Pseudomonas aeruginosa]
MNATGCPDERRVKMGKDKIHWRISAEDVLAVLEYYNAASLKAQQTALSGTATQLEKLLGGPLHKLLEPEEANAIRKAGEIVRSINIRVEHAKEIKRREEKQREARLKARKALIDAEIRAAIPRPQATAENVIRITTLAMALHQEKFILDFYDVPTVIRQFQERLQRALKEKALGGYMDYVHTDIVRGLSETLDYRQSGNPRADIAAALSLCESWKPRYRPTQEFLDFVHHQIAIEHSTNVERLPVKKKPAGR